MGNDSKIKRFRWAVVGTGSIARRFISELRHHPAMEFRAVVSSDRARAEALAQEFEIPIACAGLEELLVRDDIDVVYIGTVHTLHVGQTIACLKAGFAVLSEKPLGVRPGGVEQVIETVAQTGVFAMEAMKTIFLPAMRKGLDWYAQGKIGEIRQMRASFCFNNSAGPEHRLLNPMFAGGAILDVGYYGIEASRWFLGLDEVEIFASGAVGPTGVEEHAVILLQYPNGAIASSHCAINCVQPVVLEVFGSAGSLHFERFNQAREVTFIANNGQREIFEESRGIFVYEVEEVHRCLKAGLSQSPIMPLGATLATSRVMDAALRQVHGDALPAYLEME